MKAHKGAAAQTQERRAKLTRQPTAKDMRSSAILFVSGASFGIICHRSPIKTKERLDCTR